MRWQRWHLSNNKWFMFGTFDVEKIVYVPPAETWGIASKINHSNCLAIRQMLQTKHSKFTIFKHKIPSGRYEIVFFLRIHFVFSKVIAHSLFVILFVFIYTRCEVHLNVVVIFYIIRTASSFLNIRLYWNVFIFLSNSFKKFNMYFLQPSFN